MMGFLKRNPAKLTLKSGCVPGPAVTDVAIRALLAVCFAAAMLTSLISVRHCLAAPAVCIDRAFVYIRAFMLDLGFVREHLPLLQEKLRQRGLEPGAVLKDFSAFEAQRRKLITEAETLRAQQNRASEEVARLKKEKQDATTLIAEM